MDLQPRGDLRVELLGAAVGQVGEGAARIDLAGVNVAISEIDIDMRDHAVGGAHGAGPGDALAVVAVDGGESALRIAVDDVADLLVHAAQAETDEGGHGQAGVEVDIAGGQIAVGRQLDLAVDRGAVGERTAVVVAAQARIEVAGEVEAEGDRAVVDRQLDADAAAIGRAAAEIAAEAGAVDDVAVTALGAER